MRFAAATIPTMAAAATATVIPRADYGAWNVTITSDGTAASLIETVTGVYANAQLNDNVPVNCNFHGKLNGEVVNKLTCDPESFSYIFEDAGYDDGYLYQLTLTQTVALDGTNVTVKGTSDKFKKTSGGVTGKSFIASDVLVQASTAVA